MWLINTTSLELERFDGPVKPPYAILSHTWEGEEVQFPEFRTLDKTKTGCEGGSAKIRHTCDIARQNKLQYAWVDTCCIDKSSSAELSESINSMYAWYKNATVCLVYLQDLPHDTTFEHGLARCKWLTRGWTLQELIAPRHVDFFDQVWTKRTTKLASTKLLATATGVDEAVLAGKAPLGRIPVAQRMSWLSQRRTTRIEDMAYCMLGIFDIFLPLIYGEGEKAFLRLQEEIAKQTCDLSLFAWTAPPPPPLGHFERLENFRGVFANSPSEFASCHRMHHRNPNIPHREFTITNRGLRIETKLIKLVGASHDELVLNLGHSFRSPEDIDPNTGAGWLGIFVRKSIHGYVRVRSHLLYESGSHNRIRCPRAMLCIRKNVDSYDIQLLRGQYARAVHVDTRVTDIRTVQTYPSDLWDDEKRLFLDPGYGLNIYVELTVSTGTYDAAFRAILACSTKNTLSKLPSCVLWSEQDPGGQDVYHWLREATELTDYTTVDYLLRDFVPEERWGAATATCSFTDQRMGCRTVLEARLDSAIVEGSEQFRIQLFKQSFPC